MVKRLAALVALLLMVVPTVGVAQAAPAFKKHRPIVVVKTPTHGVAPGTLAGTLSAMNGSVLTLTASGGVTYTIDVSTTTKIVRLYDGPSGLDELSPGDALLVRGATVATNTIQASWIKDQSIQRAFTRMVGTIQSVGANSVTVMVTRDSAGPSPFAIGQIMTITLGATTNVISPTATTTTVFTGTAGMPTLSGDIGGKVTVLGSYNRLQNTFTTVYRIVLFKGAKVAVVKQIEGTLLSESGITAPATLSVQTVHMGVVTVTVAASPTVLVVRRFNGHSSLDELADGDHVIIDGAFADATTFVATKIKDNSIQEADVRAVLKITGTPSATSFTGTVLKDIDSVRTPFDEGSAVTVMLSSATKIYVPATAPATGEVLGTPSSLAAGQTVTVRGTYNRKQHTYTLTKLVRVHRS